MMPIPTAFDYQLREVEDAGQSVLLALRTMRHASNKDIPRMRAGLRDRLQELANLAMAAAPDADA
jgi:hypothetical protein